MAQAELRVQVNIKEINDVVCKKCKKKIRDLIRDKITEDMVTQVIGGE